MTAAHCSRAAMLGLAFALAASVAQAQTPAKITVTSSTMKEGEAVPNQHTPYGRNDSPPLSWSGVPASAKEIVVICEDPDAGNPPPFVHWVMYKIPATAKGLPEALPLDNVTPLPAELAGAPPPAVAALNSYAWRQHCRGLFQIPMAA